MAESTFFVQVHLLMVFVEFSRLVIFSRICQYHETSGRIEESTLTSIPDILNRRHRLRCNIATGVREFCVFQYCIVMHCSANGCIGRPSTSLINKDQILYSTD